MSQQRDHVTQGMADGIANFCGELLELLRMPQWTILIMVDPCEEDSLARIEPIDGKHVAQLHLCRDWMGRSEREQLNTITHEVLHLVHAKLNHAVWEARDFMHDYEHDHVWRRYKMETEYMVDHLAFFLHRTHKLQEAWDIAHGRNTEKEES